MRILLPDLNARLSNLRNSLDAAFSSGTAMPGFVGKTLSSGHCAAVSLVINELFGGELVSSTVEGQSHWFNRLEADGNIVDVDATGDQFGLPKVQIGIAGTLYSRTRVRRRDEANHETIERAIQLAERARLWDVSTALRAFLFERLHSSATEGT
jgi:hypothetical protein